MRRDSPQTVHLLSLVQALYSSGSIRYPSSSGPSPHSPLATPPRHSHLVGQFRCVALAFTPPPPVLSSTLKRVTDRASVSSPHHACTKHIDIRYHFIRHVVETGALNLIYCPTDEMIADILTKALPRWKINFHTITLGLRRACGGVMENADSEDQPGTESGPPTAETRDLREEDESLSRDASALPQ
jgi:hypothetical protein